jgi:hypothetical protein
MPDAVHEADPRLLLLAFFEAEAPRPGARPPARWADGPWTHGESTHDGGALMPAIRNMVIGPADNEVRWHLDLEHRPLTVDSGAGRIVALETVRLTGLTNTYIVVTHTAVDAGLFTANPRPLDLAALIEGELGPGWKLSQQWTPSHIHPPVVRPTPVHELLIGPEDWTCFPEPWGPVPPEGHDLDARMYVQTREEAEFDEEDMQRGFERRFVVGSGTVVIGSYRSAAQHGHRDEYWMRTFVTDALLFGIAQNIMLHALSRLALSLSDPARDPAAAAALSSGSVAFRALYGWTGGAMLGSDRRIVEQYRQLNGLPSMEVALTAFASAAQSAISAQTNVLLGMITVLTLAAALAVAVREAAEWNDWASLWAVPLAAVIAAGLLLLPQARALRAALFGRHLLRRG